MRYKYYLRDIFFLNIYKIIPKINFKILHVFFFIYYKNNCEHCIRNTFMLY